jgi:hypothetical protein
VNFACIINVVKFPINKNKHMTPIKLSLLKNSILIFPNLTLSLIKGIPKPINKLKSGPDIEPDNAISLYPKLTKLKFNIKSDILFP